METELIRGTLVRVQTHKADSNWCALRFQEELKEFWAVGTCEFERLCEGMIYELSGTWKQHAKYGRQFAFQSLRREKPLTRDQICRYLTKYAHGIGDTLANRIYDAFGDQSLEALKNTPEIVAEKVAKINLDMARDISEALRKRETTEVTRAELMQMFSGLRIADSSIEACIKKWGLSAPEVIRENAYVLLHPDIPRIGFGTADKVYLALGGEPMKRERMVQCLRFIIESQVTGSTWLPKDQLEAEFVKLLIHPTKGKIQPEEVSEVFMPILMTCVDCEWAVVQDNMVASTLDFAQERTVCHEAQRVVKRKSGLMVVYAEAAQEASVLNSNRPIRKFGS